MRWNILINAENNRFFDPNGRKFSIKAELFKARLRWPRVSARFDFSMKALEAFQF